MQNLHVLSFVRSSAARFPRARRLPGSPAERQLALNPFYVYGPAYGGVVGDVLDAARFLHLHLNDGTIDGHRVLREDTARAMRLIDRPGKPFDHGLGWFRPPSATGLPYVQHLGGGAGFRNVRLASDPCCDGASSRHPGRFPSSRPWRPSP